jgi:hypothetical protein
LDGAGAQENRSRFLDSLASDRRIRAVAKAGLLGIDPEAYMGERDPVAQMMTAARIDAAERKARDDREELAVRIIAALGRATS